MSQTITATTALWSCVDSGPAASVASKVVSSEDLVGLFEDQLNVGDPDHRPVRQDRRRNHASTVNKCSVATAQVHDLKLIGIMAPDDRVLPRDMRSLCAS